MMILKPVMVYTYVVTDGEQGVYRMLWAHCQDAVVAAVNIADEQYQPRGIAVQWIRPGLEVAVPGIQYGGGLQAYFDGFMGKALTREEVARCDMQLVYDLIHDGQYSLALALHIGCLNRPGGTTPDIAHAAIALWDGPLFKQGLREVGVAPELMPFYERAAVSGFQWSRFGTLVLKELLGQPLYFLVRGVDGLFWEIVETITLHEWPLTQFFVLNAAESSTPIVQGCLYVHLGTYADCFAPLSGRTGAKQLFIPLSRHISYGMRVEDEPAHGMRVLPVFHGITVTDKMRESAIRLYTSLVALMKTHMHALASRFLKCWPAWSFLYLFTDAVDVHVVGVGVVDIREQLEKLHVGMFLIKHAKPHWTRIANEYSGAQYGFLTTAEAAQAHADELVLTVGRRTRATIAALMLGIQRLEEMGVLLLAHQAMLEEMLECLVLGDVLE